MLPSSRSFRIYFNFLVICLLCCPVISRRTYSKQYVRKLREEVREMFQHAYNGYLEYASDYDELRPLSCDGVNTWGSYSLTLIDALDTLAVMGNYTEFRRVVKLLSENTNFDKDINVSVFETNIRIVGGLLSAHLMSHKAGAVLEAGWPCNGPLLRLAEDVARRLLPAFDTKTGMPYGTVNLKHGVPAGETPVTCTAGVGTFIVEFGALSRLTGDPIYEETALNALYALWNHKSPIGLFGNHIDVQTGRWTAQDSGIGAGIDSYYEYLVKGSIMLNRPELLEMFHEGRKAIEKYMNRDDWYVWVSMNKGQVTLPVFQSLEAYWPGVLSLIGETTSAMRTLRNYHSVWRQYGFLPEFYNIPTSEASTNRESYPLRPELIESIMHLYKATGDQFLLEMGEDILHSIQYSAKTKCGYATIKNVRDHMKEDRMESFFLAETTKYLYLLFDPTNFLNNDGGHGDIIETQHGQCVIDAGGFVYNTEAHPIDPAALRCCHELPRKISLDLDFAKYRGDVLKFKSEKDDKYTCAQNRRNVAPITVHLSNSLDTNSGSIKKYKVDDNVEKSPESECDNLKHIIEEVDNFSRDIMDELHYMTFKKFIKEMMDLLTPQLQQMDKIMHRFLESIKTVCVSVRKVSEKFNFSTLEEMFDLLKFNGFQFEDAFGHHSLNQILVFDAMNQAYELVGKNIIGSKVIETLHQGKNLKGTSFVKKIQILSKTLEELKVSNEIAITPDNVGIYNLLMRAQDEYETYISSKKIDIILYKNVQEILKIQDVAKRLLDLTQAYETYKQQKSALETNNVDTKLSFNAFSQLMKWVQQFIETEIDKKEDTEKQEQKDDEKNKEELIIPDEILYNANETTRNINHDNRDDIILPMDEKHETEVSYDKNSDGEIIGKGTVEPVSLEYDTSDEDETDQRTEDPTKSVDASELSSDDSNSSSSMLSGFVETILKSTLPTERKFDSQLFLEKIRLQGLYHNKTQNFELFYCRAQPFLQRFSGWGGIL